ARGLALGVGHHALAIAVGLLGEARRRAARLGHHVVVIGLALVLLALQVLLGAHRVVERGLHLLGRLGVLHGDFADGNTGLVTVQYFLHQLLRRHRHLLAAL